MSEQYQVFELTGIFEANRRLKELAAQGYELVALAPPTDSSGAIYVMRLSSTSPERQQPLLPQALAYLTERVRMLESLETSTFIDHLECRAKALEADSVELHKTKAHVDDLTALDQRVNKAQETLANVDGRLAEVQEQVCQLEAALERYQDTHVETHRYLDARAREFGECDATLLQASKKEQGRLDEVERRLAAMEKRLAALEGGACGGVWRKSNAD